MAADRLAVIMADARERVLRLGTRGSLLARTQSGMVADALMARHPGLKVDLHIIKTSGDRIQDKPLHEFGGKGLFTKELEQALLAGTVDFAVHSFKDVPVTMPLVDVSGLIIAAVPEREDHRDAFACHTAKSFLELPAGAKVGTGSLRRRCQILARRPDLVVEPIRGNIDTRLRKAGEGLYDAVILAMAGVKRAGLFDPHLMSPIDDGLLCAPGQGALALQCRKDDSQTVELLAALDHADTALAVQAERAIVQGLNGDCHSPIAAYAKVDGQNITLQAAVGARDGDPPVIFASGLALRSDTTRVVADVLQSLRSQGVEALLTKSA